MHQRFAARIARNLDRRTERPYARVIAAALSRFLGQKAAVIGRL
jgi:hypothetical protein